MMSETETDRDRVHMVLRKDAVFSSEMAIDTASPHKAWTRLKEWANQTREIGRNVPGQYEVSKQVTEVGLEKEGREEKNCPFSGPNSESHGLDESLFPFLRVWNDSLLWPTQEDAINPVHGDEMELNLCCFLLLG
jgi:hypothetical protein